MQFLIVLVTLFALFPPLITTANYPIISKNTLAVSQKKSLTILTPILTLFGTHRTHLSRSPAVGALAGGTTGAIPVLTSTFRNEGTLNASLQVHRSLLLR